MSSAPEKKYLYVQDARNDQGDLIARGTFKKGMKIGKDVYKTFELRELNAGDLLDAESDATTDKPLNYNTAVLIRQLVSVGTFTGPFVVPMIRSLNSSDFSSLREAQAELSIAGEVEQ